MRRLLTAVMPLIILVLQGCPKTTPVLDSQAGQAGAAGYGHAGQAGAGGAIQVANGGTGGH